MRGLGDIKLNDLGLGVKVKNFSIQTKYDPGLKLRNESESRIRAITGAIDRAMIRAILDISDNIERNLALAITSSIWNTNEGLGDIYLTGKLLSSSEVSVNGSQITINYDVPYAALIYYGGYILPYGNKEGTRVYIPPRPWIGAVLNGTNGLPAIDYKAIILAAISGNI